MKRIISSFYRSATGQAVLLFGYLFLVMTSYIAGKVSRDALFLDQFKAIQLPYADIAIAILVGFVIAAYVRAGRYFPMHTLLVLSLAAYALTCLGFWWAATHYQFAWLYPVVYVWIGIFGVLATAQVWTLANYVFTTREAKSSFSVIGSGAISGAIAGGYVAKVFAGRFGAESLLLVMAAALSVSIGLVMLIWNARRQESLAEPGTVEPDQSGLAAQIHGLWTSPHLRSIAILICLSSFATTTASWQFKAIAKQAIPTTAELAAFFGEFNFYAAILALLVQMLLTSRLLKRYGIGPALLLVPVALLGGSAGVILFGTLAAAVTLKSVDQVFRYSVDKSSMELLYLPVPSGIKIQAKSFIDTVVWRMGDGLAGIGVLIAANYFHATPRTVGWVTLAVAALWATVALLARRTYVSSLRDIVQSWRTRVQAHTPETETPAPTTLTSQADSAKIGAALDVEIAHHYRSYRVLQEVCEVASASPARIAQLQETMGLEAGRIFRLLGILYPDSDLDSAYAAIRSRVPAVRDSALELLENTLDLRLRRLLVPLFDESLSIRDRARIASRLLGEDPEQPKQLVWTLARSNSSWLRSHVLPALQGLRLL